MDLDVIKEVLHKKETELAKLQGQEETLLAELHKGGFKDFESLETELVKLDKQIEKDEEAFEKNTEKFKEEFSELLED